MSPLYFHMNKLLSVYPYVLIIDGTKQNNSKMYFQT